MNIKRLTTIIALAASMLIGGQVVAESSTGNASVMILDTLTFNEVSIVDFGVIPTANGTCTMASNGSLSGQCAGRPNGTLGDFLVAGTPNQSISVSVRKGKKVGGVTFLPALDTPATTTLDNSGNATVNVRGELDLNNATLGSKALTYTLTVNFQ